MVVNRKTKHLGAVDSKLITGEHSIVAWLMQNIN